MQRIGVAFPGGDPASPATWSGTPAGLISGLRSLGIEPVPLTIGAPAALRTAASRVLAFQYLRPTRDWRRSVRQALGSSRSSPLMSHIDSAATPPRFGEREDLDAIIQIGTGVSIRSRIPIATYEDMTVAQNREHPYDQYALLSESAMNRRITRQRDAYSQAVACCLATDWAARSVVDDYDVPAAKVHVVGVGAYPAVPVASRDWSTPRFLFVGMDWERKNGPAVIRAFTQLRAEIPTAKLDVVGQHPQLSLDGVTSHGVLRRDVPDERRVVEELFSTATCFIMPSRLEAAGIVYVEAAAAGIPVIGTTVGGASWLIGNGGIVIDPSEDDQLLGAMRQLSDPDVARRTGELGRGRAAMFTWPAVAERIVEALSGDLPTPW